MIRKTLLCLALLCAAAVAQQTPASPWVTRREGVAAGNVQQFKVPSKIYGASRRVWVYTPAGYDKSRRTPYDLLVCFDGADHRDDGSIPLPTILDNLIAAGKLPPLVVLLVDNGTGAQRITELGNSARFVQSLAEELLPGLRQGWNVTSDPQRVIVSGFSVGGLAAAYVAYKRPDLFGNVLSQSGAFWRGDEASNSPPYEWLAEQFRNSPKLPLRFYLEVGALETARAIGTGPTFIETNRRLRDVLKAKGYPIFYKEVPGARHENVHWKNEIADGLLWLAGDWDKQ